MLETSVFALKEETSPTLDWLFQIEAEISCFKGMMRGMELEQEQDPKDKTELAKQMLNLALLTTSGAIPNRLLY